MLKKPRVWACWLAMAWWCCCAGLAAGDGGLAADQLRCEYLREPLGVEAASPRLSWVVNSSRRAEVQTAYRVLVASSAERLARDEGDLWDSGRVASASTCQVAYGGGALRSRAACCWKVMAW